MTHEVAAAGFMDRIRAFYVICTCGQEFTTLVSRTPSGTGRYSEELMVSQTTKRFREHAASTVTTGEDHA